ncbi:MAG TPA: hypothetical protein VKA14_04170 [Gammaproteobacteria bacterium]|nr:hypothetical protein [Gammaproteobacteria bacterium]
MSKAPSSNAAPSIPALGSRPALVGGVGILLALVCMVVLTAVLYWPGVHGGFALDDYPNIVNNPAVHLSDLRPDSLLAAAFSSHAGILGRPLSLLSIALNEYLWGPGPYSMKAVNIAVHACNGLLVYAVAALILLAWGRRFRPELDKRLIQWTAVAMATAWLVLPINLTAVLYVVQRMTSLAGMFTLAGIALYLWGRLRMLDGKAGLWMAWTGIVAGGALGVLAKEVAALLPLYALVIEWTLFRFAGADGGRDRRLYWLYGTVLALPALVGLFWVVPGRIGHNAYAGRTFTLGQRLLTEPRVLLDYIGWTLVPNPHALSLYHDDYRASRGLLTPWTTLSSLLGMLGLLAIALWQRRRRPLVSLGILWFFAGQLLTGTVFNLELVYEHRNYLPSIGLLLALVSVIVLEPPLQRMALARRALLGGLIVLYAAVTGLRVHQWSDPLRFAAVSAAEHPASPRATYALGRLYSSLVDGPDSRFLTLANRALEKAAAVPDAGILPEQGLLLTNAKYHQPLKAAWWENMRAKLRKRPASAQDASALSALVYCQLREQCAFPTDHMVSILVTAMTRNPANPDFVAIYGNYALNVLHDPPLARRLMVKATRMAPATAQYRINLIKLDIFLGRHEDARHEIHRLRKLNRFGHLDETLRRMHRRLERARNAAHAPGAHPSSNPGHAPPRLGARP